MNIHLLINDALSALLTRRHYRVTLSGLFLRRFA